MKKAIIFDLDLTLVDSSIAENYRKNKRWPDVYNLIPSFQLYEGMDDVFSFIRNNDIKVCIVSMAPRPYVERVVRHFIIPCDSIVAYHDAQRKKPHPEPMINALKNLKELPENTISFGDKNTDIQSSNAANIESVGCLWGCENHDLLVNSNPSYVINNPKEIVNILIKE